MGCGQLLSRSRRLASVLAMVLIGSAPMLATAPAGAAQVTESQHAAARNYVALGDSFASGEGIAPYADGTDTATDQCHRSVNGSYPAILQRRHLPAFDHLTSVACSGALTGNLFGDLPAGVDASAEPAQLDTPALTSRTRTVTLTIGGNDAGFSRVLAACVYSPVPGVVPGQAGCASVLDQFVTAAIAHLAGPAEPPGSSASVPYATILKAIHAKAPHARIYFTGYPQLFGTTFNSSGDCQVGQLPGAALFFSGPDVRWLRTKTAELNAAIKGSVARARQSGIDVRYVNVAKTFKGHGLCDRRASWINGVIITFSSTGTPQVQPWSFHPTARGFRAYADAVGRSRAHRSAH